MSLASNRRQFLKRTAFATGGIAAATQFFPNLITSRLYAGSAIIVDEGGDKRAALLGACFARKFSLGTWGTARVGMMYEMTDAGQGFTSLTPTLLLGMCSGTAALPMDNSTTNYLGFRTQAATWSYTAGSKYFYNNGTCAYGKKVGSTFTESTTSIFDQFAIVGAGPACRIVEIIKGTPNYSLSLFYNNSIQAVSRSDFETAMIAVTPTIANYTWVTGLTVAFDEVAGALDAVTVGWDRGEASLEVTELAVSKIA